MFGGVIINDNKNQEDPFLSRVQGEKVIEPFDLIEGQTGQKPTYKTQIKGIETSIDGCGTNTSPTQCFSGEQPYERPIVHCASTKHLSSCSSNNSTETKSELLGKCIVTNSPEYTCPDNTVTADIFTPDELTTCSNDDCIYIHPLLENVNKQDTSHISGYYHRIQSHKMKGNQALDKGEVDNHPMINDIDICCGILNLTRDRNAPVWEKTNGKKAFIMHVSKNVNNSTKKYWILVNHQFMHEKGLYNSSQNYLENPNQTSSSNIRIGFSVSKPMNNDGTVNSSNNNQLILTFNHPVSNIAIKDETSGYKAERDTQIGRAHV